MEFEVAHDEGSACKLSSSQPKPTASASAQRLNEEIASIHSLKRERTGQPDFRPHEFSQVTKDTIASWLLWVYCRLRLATLEG